MIGNNKTLRIARRRSRTAALVFQFLCLVFSHDGWPKTLRMSERAACNKVEAKERAKKGLEFGWLSRLRRTFFP